jgi:prephenate dehydrogenase
MTNTINKNLIISIIGFGNFGKFAAKHLVLAGASVFVTDINNKTKEAQEIGARFVSLNEALKNRIIILAVPMEDLEETLEKIKEKLIPKAVVLDVCSLKMFACEAMNRILPKNIEIIGTHPLFGQQSVQNSINGMRIALVNVRAKQETFEKAKVFCESLGLNVILTTTEEHDRQMAVSQALTHFIGMVCKKMNIQRVNLSTKTFDDLMNIIDIIKNDTPALFNNMQTMNSFAGSMREDFIRNAKELNLQLKSESRRT